MATPALRALKRSHPRSELWFVTNEEYVPLVTSDPNIDRVIALPRRLTRIRDLRVFFRELANFPFDLAIDLQGTLESARCVYAVDSKVRCGISMIGPRLGWYLVHKRNLALHSITELGNFLSALGVELLDPNPYLVLSETTRKDAKFFLNKHSLKSYIVINPFTSHPNRNWPLKRFQSLIHRMREFYDGDFVITGRKSEQDEANELMKDIVCKGVHSFVGMLPIDLSCAVYEKADLMITADSGPMHAAASLGTPVLSLFGPSLADRNGPWGQLDHVIQERKPPNHHYFLKSESRSFMEAISVDAVEKGARALLTTLTSRVMSQPREEAILMGE